MKQAVASMDTFNLCLQASPSSRFSRNRKLARWRRDTHDSKNALSQASKRKQKRLRIKNRRRRKRIKNKNNRRQDPRIVGILDRRIPEEFRQAEFITISLTKFVVLSTGVTAITQGWQSIFYIFYSPYIHLHIHQYIVYLFIYLYHPFKFLQRISICIAIACLVHIPSFNLP